MARGSSHPRTSGMLYGSRNASRSVSEAVAADRKARGVDIAIAFMDADTTRLVSATRSFLRSYSAREWFDEVVDRCADFHAAISRDFDFERALYTVSADLTRSVVQVDDDLKALCEDAYAFIAFAAAELEETMAHEVIEGGVKEHLPEYAYANMITGYDDQGNEVVRSYESYTGQLKEMSRRLHAVIIATWLQSKSRQLEDQFGYDQNNLRRLTSLDWDTIAQDTLAQLHTGESGSHLRGKLLLAIKARYQARIG
jgi:hypothetical protein